MKSYPTLYMGFPEFGTDTPLLISPPASSVLDFMKSLGGSFVQSLAALYEAADVDNRRKILETWKDVWVRYRELARPQSVLFLDVDGVLNTGVGRGIDAEKLALLAGIVAKSECEVVLSSSWRETPEQLERLDKVARLAGFTISDATPLDVSKSEGGIAIGRTRTQEIEAWILHRGTPKSMVIIDDDEITGDLADYHVRTRTDIGLTEKHLMKAIDILDLSTQ